MPPELSMEPPSPKIDSLNQQLTPMLQDLLQSGIFLAEAQGAEAKYKGVFGVWLKDTVNDPELPRRLNLNYKPSVSISPKRSGLFLAFSVAMGSHPGVLQSMKNYWALSGSPGTNLKRPLVVEQSHPGRPIREKARDVDHLTSLGPDCQLENHVGQGVAGVLKPTPADLASLDLVLMSLGMEPEGFWWNRYFLTGNKDEISSLPSMCLQDDDPRRFFFERLDSMGPTRSSTASDLSPSFLGRVLVLQPGSVSTPK